MSQIYLTVQEMIEKGGFSDFVIYAGGEGLGRREVKTICVVDTVDVEGWLFGGEFLLSSGYIFRENPELLGSLIETASRGGAAALGVKIGRYIDRIPQEVLRIADRLAFPLIGVPLHYAHTDIINPALVTITDKKAEQMDRRDEIWQEFLDCILSGASVEAVLSILRKHIGTDALYIDATTGDRHLASDSAEFARVADEVPLASLMDHFPFETVRLSERGERGEQKELADPKDSNQMGVVKDAGADGGRDARGERARRQAQEWAIRGYLFLEREASAPDALVAIEQARHALRLLAKWEAERWRIERGRGEMFVQDILFKRFRHDSEIRSRGRTLGWELGGLHAVALVAVDGERSIQREPHEPHARAFEIFHSMLRKLQPTVPHAQLDDSMAFILRAPQEEWGDIRKRLEEVFALARRQARLKTGLQIAMGVGSPVDNMLSCDRSFWEAKRVLAMSRENETGSTPLFWEEMGVYKLLAPILGTPDAANFVREQLGPLLDHTKNQQAGDTLADTLFCIIRSNWQLKPVASRMNLHYNTVKYRYRKIEELLGFDLEAPSVRMNLAMAMELHMLARSERTSTEKQDK